jgi:glycosyltransferase involved in cell wall biosynthesis
MKIAFVAGAHTVHSNRIAKYFVAKGHEVHVFTYHLKNIESTESITLHKIGLPKWSLNLPYYDTWFRIWRFWISINKLKPDIIHGHNVDNIGGSLPLLLSGFPSILSPWGTDVLIAAKESFFIRKMIVASMKKSFFVTVESEYMKNKVNSLGIDKRKIKLIPFGVDMTQFNPNHSDHTLKQKLGFGNDPVIFSMRNFQEIYNLECLIFAIPEVLKEIPNAKFMLAGSGRLEPKIKRMVKELKINPSVFFLGQINHEDLPAYLSISDIYVSTSLSDSSSVSLLEAMSSSMACVVSDAPSNDEWITHGKNGYIFKRRDYRSLSNYIVKLLRNPETRNKFGNKSHSKIKKNAELSLCFNNYEDLYNQSRNVDINER